MAKRELRYPVYVRWSDDDEAWIAEVPDLPGCMADGETREAAIREAARVAEMWIETARKHGRGIPAPSGGEPSGKFVARLPKWLHRKLQEMAQREAVSLNQLVISLLASREAEHRTEPHKPRARARTARKKAS
jgi:antitoxin HicB